MVEQEKPPEKSQEQQKDVVPLPKSEWWGAMMAKDFHGRSKVDKADARLWR